MLFCALCCCRCLPKLKQFFFSDPEDRRGSNQRDYQPPAPNYSKSKSASICSVSQLPAGKRSSNAQQHFQPVSIEVNQSSPTPPATGPPVGSLSARRLSAINVSSINTSPSPTLATNLSTISGVRVPYPRSPQSKSQQQQLRVAAVQSSGAINELGLVNTSPQSQQVRTPRTRASISNLLTSPKLSTNFDYPPDHQPVNNNNFEFKNLNYNTSGGLRAPGYAKQRRYSTAEAFATHTSPYLPSQMPKSRRHSRAVADIPSPSQPQYHNERTILNRKKYSLANQTAGDGGQLLINKTLVQTQEHARKYSNSSTPSSSRKQSRTDLAQLQQLIARDEAEQPSPQNYQEYIPDAYGDQFSGELQAQQYATETYPTASKYGKRHSASHQLQPQHYLPAEQQADYNQYETG